MFIILICILFTFNHIELCEIPNVSFLNWYLDNQTKCLKQDLYDSQMVCFTNETIKFKMGTYEPIFKYDGEAPLRLVKIKKFCIDKTEVSNKQFYEFVKATGYKTQAELIGDSFGFVNFLSEQTKNTLNLASPEAPWWVLVKNASWHTPEGSDSNIKNRPQYPVVHVSWNDAYEFCKFMNKRLPTEAEWEYACRGGLNERLYPWGNIVEPKGKHMMNIWQGDFPQYNRADDGFISTSPVDTFEQNKFYLNNMVGNVWEWVDDWWQIDHTSEIREYPSGPSTGKEKVKKGGSFMCHPKFCHRYRCAARSQSTPDTSASHIGFRCALTYHKKLTKKSNIVIL